MPQGLASLRLTRNSVGHKCIDTARASRIVSDEETVSTYNQRVSDCVGKYELLQFEDLHSDIIDLIPEKSGLILDIGAGSGRDAAWFACRGWNVVAIDPAEKMLHEAKQLHQNEMIRWIQDKLPGLERTIQTGLTFDVIWLSAVWMHINPTDRHRAFRKMVSLLRPSGWIMMSLRHGSFTDGRKSYDVSSEEIDKLARQHGLAVRRVCKSHDRFSRDGVTWEWVCLQFPDDGTEALPLLRHIILTENKSSTYKLALLRVLVRIADGAIGVVKEVDDDTVAIPLGLLALYWIRMYKPLIEAGIPQMPQNTKGTGLGFVKEDFHKLGEYSSYDLTVGQQFAGGNAEALLGAMLDARDTICKMPAFYIKYPNSSEQVFGTTRAARFNKTKSFILDKELFWAFGEFRIPRSIWVTMSRFAAWIEPALLSEWVRLMQDYSMKAGQAASYDSLMKALTWIDPVRDTTLVRSLVNKRFASGNSIFCVWSGQKLNEETIDIDHCFPFAAWPCGDLWNLMPTLRSLNQREKKDKLITASTLAKSSDRIVEWWHDAYELSGSVLADRFYSEVNASLSILSPAGQVLASEEIIDGMLLKRAALKRDLQLDDWNY